MAQLQEQATESKWKKFIKDFTWFDKKGKVGGLSALGAGLSGFAAGWKDPSGTFQTLMNRDKPTLQDLMMAQIYGNIDEDTKATIAANYAQSSEATTAGVAPLSLDTPSYGSPNPTLNIPSLTGAYNGGGIPPTEYSLKPSFLTQDPVNALNQQFAQQIRLKNMETQSGIQKKISEDLQKAEQALSPTKRLFNLYQNSMSELQQRFPDVKIGEGGWQDYLTRKYANIEVETGSLPATRAFKTRKKKLAYEGARVLEGGRVTDQDVKIVADAMIDSLDAPTETNIINAVQELNSITDKGAGEKVGNYINELLNSGNSIAKNIAIRYLEDNSDWEEQ